MMGNDGLTHLVPKNSIPNDHNKRHALCGKDVLFQAWTFAVSDGWFGGPEYAPTCKSCLLMQLEIDNGENS